MNIRCALALAALWASAAVAQPASPDYWRDDFAVPGAYLATSPGSEPSVLAFADDGEGGLYVAGNFQNIDGVAVQGIAQWTGTGWRSIGGIEGDNRARVEALLLLEDGTLVVAGVFDRAIGPTGATVAAGGLARWDGESWHSLGQLERSQFVSGMSLALAEADGVLYVGGQFTSITNLDGSTTDEPGLARWTGAAWESFGGPGGFFGGEAGQVYALETLPNGDLLVGAGGSTAFRDAQGNEIPGARGIARWNGEAWSAVGQGLNGVGATASHVGAIHVDGDGEVVIGGAFAEVSQSNGSNLSVRNVARWDGTEWTSLGGIGLEVRGLAEANGALYAVGSFRTIVQPDGTEVQAIGTARWTGSSWEALPGSYGEGAAVFPYGDGVVVGWSGNEFDGGIELVDNGSGVRTSALAVYGSEGWRPLSARFDGAQGIGFGSVAEVEVDPCGDIAVGGGFSRAGGLQLSGLARWDGTTWEAPWGSLFGLIPYASAFVFTGACDDAPAMYLIGSFDEIVAPDGTRTDLRNVAHWNGAEWSPLGGGLDRYGSPAALAQGPDGIYVGGNFRSVVQAGGQSVEVNSIARWDGTVWSSLGEGIDWGVVHALTVTPQGHVIAGGLFSAVINPGGASVPANGLAAWVPGSGWETFGFPSGATGFGGEVRALAQTQSGLVVAGVFESILDEEGETVLARNVALWDGEDWHPLGDGIPNYVGGLTVDADGRVLATSEDPYVWTGETWELLGGGVQGGGTSGIAVADGIVYVAGTFKTAGGVPSPSLAAYDLATAVPTIPAPPQASSATLRATPNPARGATTFRFEASGSVRLAVYDAIGREVAVLHDGQLAEGTHMLSFDATDLPSGVYIARLTSPTGAASRTFSVVR